ncbi:MAG TPA: DUF805 domain-containing protein [Gammaproteobacteria bacterium]
MQNRNPYAAPRTNVSRAESAEEYGEIKVFSAQGRIGRVRYIGYSFGLTILIAMFIGMVAALLGGASPAVALTIGAVGYIAIIVVQILLTIQRAHDMNVTGWLCLISLIPLAALVFLLVPGTPGENNYGKPPPPNTTGAVVLACILPIIMILGIVAAIAVPAYQDYAERAAASTPQTQG